MNNWFKKNGVHLAIIVFFVALCFVYFTPAFQGKVLVQHDVSQAEAMQREIMAFKEKDGKAPLWTNAMFGGMPSYQIWATYPKNITTYILSGFRAMFPNPVDMVMLYLIGSYFLFTVLLAPVKTLSKPTRIILSVIGALAFAFSSYNFIIIEAGHGNKALAIGFFAPILAGLLLTLRGKYWLGAGISALFISLAIRANHIQMTYYLFIALLILMLIYLIHAYKTKTFKTYLKSTGFLIIAVIVAIAVNFSMLWTTYEYGQLSIRGKANLTQEPTEKSTGLDKEYAYQWSQGIGECITFLIPNAYGGASSPTLDGNSHVAKVLKDKGVDVQQAEGFAQQMPTYWGPKPFTSGPWYFGAIVFFLFIYGLFVVKSKLKWWLLSATLLSIVLSFGKYFDLISNIFFDYFPLYNKFRAVESILVIASLCFPILAIMAIVESLKPKNDQQWLIKKLKLSGYIIGGILVVLWLIPTLFFNFRAENHQDFINQLNQLVGDTGFANSIAQALIDDRIALFKADALRSLAFVIIAFVSVWAIITKKLNVNTTLIAMGVVILADMWTVDKRYLNNEKFVSKSVLSQQWKAREVDDFILRDKDPDFRVLDLTIPTFSSANATYFHKTIGGYHAAKLKRLQELIEKQFSGSINQDVLDMLNTKYFITSGQEGQNVSMKINQTACGHAWFVDNIQFVKNNDEEMAAISSFDPKKEAIINDEFKTSLDLNKLGTSEGAKIELVSYHPDHLKYEYSTSKKSIAVFSEIWYPKGWKMYVDGEETPYIRANYVLRAAELPGGNHTIEWKFEPKSYYFGENISLIGSVLLSLILAFAIFRQKSQEQKA
ncbi:YfhO family protein [Pseudopedobacter beijingensis]|uniref:YfhO family protein n=1 Tax=Pseudopedobacter beijingensis TaxID=1207056 RepID=A0ABW4I8J0_9SPHI